jgi:hypothetical protein
MSLSKRAAEEIAKSEIARSQANNEKVYTVQLYSNEKSKWVPIGKTGAEAARKFEKKYIEHRVYELLGA